MVFEIQMGLRTAQQPTAAAADASGAVAGTAPAAAVGQGQQPAAAAAVAGTSDDAGISPVAESEDSWLLVSETRLTDTSLLDTSSQPQTPAVASGSSAAPAWPAGDSQAGQWQQQPRQQQLEPLPVSARAMAWKVRWEIPLG